MKLALGTAQIGLNYGATNQTGKASVSETKKILRRAKESNIFTLDTAVAYGNSEKVLGHVGVDEFKIITKLQGVPPKISKIDNWVDSQIKGCLKRLDVDSLHGVLLHRPDDLNTSRGEEIFDSLWRLKERKSIRNVGISIYDPVQLDSLIDQFEIDIVQAPMNLMDQRLLNSGWLEKLSLLDIEVHIRSVFLQGILLVDKSRRPKYFDLWNGIFSKYDKWLVKEGLSRLEACLGFVSQFEAVDKLVVGVESEKQLNGIIQAFSSKEIKVPSFLVSEETALIDPRLWEV